MTKQLATSSAESKRQEVLEKIDKSDPLFGLIQEHFIGVDPLSGKPKIVKEVLDDMRLYIRAASGPEKIGRKVRKSIEDLANDPISHMTFLRLESPPSVTKALNKGKWMVYNFSSQAETNQRPEKLMASAISAEFKILQSGKVVTKMPPVLDQTDLNHHGFSIVGPTGYSAGFYQTTTSGTLLKKSKGRKRQDTFTKISDVLTPMVKGC